MEHELDLATFEFLIHILEVSVVLGIGVIVYITRKHSADINKEIEQRMKDEMDFSSGE